MARRVPPTRRFREVLRLPSCAWRRHAVPHKRSAYSRRFCLASPTARLGHYNADPALLFRVTQRVHEEIQPLRPDVLITGGPEGAYGHPDHRMVSSIVTQLARAGPPDVPQRVFYAFLAPEGIRAMYPEREVPPFVVPREDLLTVRVPFADADLNAGRRSFECHKTQVSLGGAYTVERAHQTGPRTKSVPPNRSSRLPPDRQSEVVQARSRH
jgi:LmbE family N-acetylglucosaminyl deacetylase